MRFAILPVLVFLLAPSAVFAEPTVRHCRIHWWSSVGTIDFERDYSGPNMLHESATTSLIIPTQLGDGPASIVVRQERVGDAIANTFQLRVPVRNRGPRRLILELDTPGGKLSFPYRYKDGSIPLDVAEAQAILGSTGKAKFRIYKDASEKGAPLQSGWFDASAYSAEDIPDPGGLFQAARQAMDQVMQQENPPCFEKGDPFPVERFLLLRCKADWQYAGGDMMLEHGSFAYQRRTPGGAVLSLSARFRGGSHGQGIDFLGRHRIRRGVTLWVHGETPRWQENEGKPYGEETQFFDISSGALTLRSRLWNRRRYELHYDDETRAGEILAANDTLSVSIYDSASGDQEQMVFPQGWRTEIERELHAGWIRLQANERKPLELCESQIIENDPLILF